MTAEITIPLAWYTALCVGASIACGVGVIRIARWVRMQNEKAREQIDQIREGVNK